MKTIFCLAALLTGVAVDNSVAQPVWKPGEATLGTGITVRGDLYYQPEANTLLVRIADKCRAYSASQLQHFEFVEETTSHHHHFTVFDVAQEGQQEAVTIIFEELTPGATVRVLQLAGSNARRISRQYGLPATRKAEWQTPQPWYVWVNGRFVAPDNFIETEFDNMLLNSPASVWRWAATKPRPDAPLVLVRWLVYYYREMHRANMTLSQR